MDKKYLHLLITTMASLTGIYMLMTYEVPVYIILLAGILFIISGVSIAHGFTLKG